MRPDSSSALKKAKKSHLSIRTPKSLDRRVLDTLREKQGMARPSFVWRHALGVTLLLLLLVGAGAFYVSRTRSPHEAKETPGNPIDNTSPPQIAQTPPQKNDIVPQKIPPLTPKIDKPNAKREQQQRLLALKRWSKDTPQTIKGEGTRVQLTAMVFAEVLSDQAVLKRTSDGQFALLKGTARFTVTPLPKGERFVVHAGGGAIEVLGTVFTVSLSSELLHVALKRGKIRFTDPSGQKTILNPGDKVAFLFKKHPPLSANKIRDRLRKLRRQGKHKKALHFIRRILPRVKSSSLKKSLLFDVASIQGEYLHNFDGACASLKKFRARYKAGKHSEMAQLLWTKYRCN